MSILLGVILGLVIYRGYEFFQSLQEIENKITDTKKKKEAVVKEIGIKGYAMYKYIQKMERRLK